MVPVKADGMSSGGASMIKKSDLLIAALAAAAIFTSVFSAGASELSVNGEDEKSGNTADTVLTLSYHDIDRNVYPGVWVDTGLGFELFLPANWDVCDLSEDEEYKDSGLMYLAKSPQKVLDDYYGQVGISESQVNPAGTEDIYHALKSDENYDYLYYCDVNSIDCVCFESSSYNTSGLVFADGGDLYTIAISPQGSARFNPVVQNILRSVRPVSGDSQKNEKASKSTAENDAG